MTTERYQIKSDDGVMKLIQAVVQQSVEDYRKAKEYLSKCKSCTCGSCRKPAGGACKETIDMIGNFFKGSIFGAAYPNIDGKWFLKTLDEYVCEQGIA